MMDPFMRVWKALFLGYGGCAASVGEMSVGENLLDSQGVRQSLCFSWLQ